MVKKLTRCAKCNRIAVAVDFGIPLCKGCLAEAVYQDVEEMIRKHELGDWYSLVKMVEMDNDE